MRILITPYVDHHTDHVSLGALARAFEAFGHEVVYSKRPLDDTESAATCRTLRADLMFTLNRARPRDLDSGIRHVAWFQDQPTIPRDLAERVRPTDIVYRILPREPHEPDVEGRCKTGILLLAMDEAVVNAFAPPGEQTVDLAHCGTLAPRPMIRRRPPLNQPIGLAIHLAREAAKRLLLGRQLPSAVQTAMLEAMAACYRPLTGTWNPDELVARMREAALRRHPALGDDLRAEADLLAHFYAIHYARLIDREALVNAMLRVSSSVEIWGEGYWADEPIYARYYKGSISDPLELCAVYARSRLNAANTLRSLVHRRTLECMAAGGFLFIHASANDFDPGGLRSCFEPGVHYGEFTPETFEEQARRWLADEKGRREIGARAAREVRERHLWRHRAAQILADLRSA